MRIKILIFGHVCIDHNISEHVEYTSAGSPAMFMTKIFRGLATTLPTIISNYGKNYLKYVKGLSIYPTRPNTKNTLVYRNIINKGKRRQYAIYLNNSSPVPLDSMLSMIISCADILIFAPLLPNFSVSYVQKLFEYAKKDTLKIMLPQGYFRDFGVKGKVITRKFAEANKIASLVDYMILSNQDCPAIFQIGKQWIRNTETKIIVTQGARGASVMSDSQIINVPTQPVLPKDIVDSVGSGDIFSSSFAYAFYKTHNLIKSINFAHQVARKCLFYTPDQISGLKFSLE
jgi:sugar/nucleoside kinase (ribokinase family)